MVARSGSFYDTNLYLLKKHHPAVGKVVTDSGVVPTGEIASLSNGYLNLKIDTDNGDCWVHPMDGPEDEIVQYLDMVPEASTGIVALVGMGLGYSALELIAQRPNIRNFAIFELDTGIFIQSLRCLDLSPLLKDPRVILRVGQNIDIDGALQPVSRALRLENIHAIKHLGVIECKGALYSDFFDRIYDYLLSHNMDGSTALVHGDKFLNNRFQHLRTMHHNYLLEGLKGLFSGIPAILVAAGPSLDKNIHLLSRIKDHGVIFAVDSALPALLAKGIQPDFVTSIDYDTLTYEKIADSAPYSGAVSLICMPWVDGNVVKKFPAEKVFWAFTASPIENWINSCFGGGLTVGGVGTVAHLNLISAIVAGCSPIVFMGQDLSYSGETDHAQNVVLGYGEDLDSVKASAETPMIKGIDGAFLPTRKDFITYKNMFETIISSNPGHYLNATAKGAHIEGTTITSMESVADRFCIKKYDIQGMINTRCKEFRLSDNKMVSQELAAMMGKIKDLRQVFRKNRKLLSSVMNELVRMEKGGKKFRSFKEFPKPFRKKIDKIDAANAAIDSERMIWRILQNLTMEGLRQSERMLHEIRGVSNDPDQYTVWFMKNLERLSKVNDVRNKALNSIYPDIVKTLGFHKRERVILKKIEQGDESLPSRFELARLYFDSGEYALAGPLLEGIIADGKENAGALYRFGCVAAYQSDYGRMDELFEEACRVDASLIKSVKKFKYEMAEQYWDKAHYSDLDKRGMLRMLLKGVRYCREHERIAGKVRSCFDDDLTGLSVLLERENVAASEIFSIDWLAELEENPNLSLILSEDALKRFYTDYGRLLFNRDEKEKALIQFEKALSLSGDDPDLFILCAEGYFSCGIIDKGVERLESAVRMDRSYAVCWENIGDNLQGENRYGDAIAAYERCFTSTPENMVVLKKMGDCYLADGQLESAREAYRQFKKRCEG